MSPESKQFIKGITEYANRIGDWRVTIGEKPKNQLIDLLEKYKKSFGTCFSLIDIKNLRTVHSHGTNRLFGIAEEDFSMEQFIHSIHPAYRWLYYAKELARLNTIKQFKAFMNVETPYAYNVFLILRLKDGKYYRVRRQSIPFGLDENGNMVLQLNLFYTGFEPYKIQQPLTQYYSYSGDSFTNHFTKAMNKAHKKALHEEIFAKIPALSPKHKKGWNLKENELNLLRYYRDHPEAKRKAVAEELGYKVHYCNELWGKIKDKMNVIFAPAHFGTPVQVALFLDQMDIL